MNSTTERSPIGQAQHDIFCAVNSVDRLIAEHSPRPGYDRVRELLGEAYDALGAVVNDPHGTYRVRITDDFEPPELDVDEDPAAYYLGLIIEHRHDGQPWRQLDSLWSIGMQDDMTVNRAVNPGGSISLDTLREWLSEDHEFTDMHYLAATARDLLPEGLLPDPELDTTSSASRQHHVDTGRYLRAGEADES